MPVRAGGGVHAPPRIKAPVGAGTDSPDRSRGGRSSTLAERLMPARARSAWDELAGPVCSAPNREEPTFVAIDHDPFGTAAIAWAHAAGDDRVFVGAHVIS